MDRDQLIAAHEGLGEANHLSVDAGHGLGHLCESHICLISRVECVALTAAIHGFPVVCFCQFSWIATPARSGLAMTVLLLEDFGLRSSFPHYNSSASMCIKKPFVAEAWKGFENVDVFDSLLLHRYGDALESGLDVFSGVERADAHVAFAAGAEAGSGGADDLGFVEKLVEEGPGIGAGVDPDIGSVISSDAGIAEAGDRFANELGVG